jgi:hypothetical protein
MINNVDALEILKIGVIGLGFLLALLAFFLLRNEQNKAQARPSILSVVKLFMAFSLVLCLIGLFAELFPEANSSKQHVASLEKENERLKVISERLEKTCDYIRTSNWLDCSDEARKSLSQWCN